MVQIHQSPPSPLLYIFTSPALHPAVQMFNVPTEIFTPGLLLLGATQSPPQMCPVNLDKEEHGQLIIMLLRDRMPLLRDYFTLFWYFPHFRDLSLPTSGYVSLKSVPSASNMHNTWVRNGIIKCVYSFNVCGDHLKCERCYTVKQIVL